MAFVQALVIALLALLIAPGTAFYFDLSPKSVVLLTGMALSLILAARSQELPRAPRLFAILLAANAASLALSTALSTNRALSLYGGSWRSFGALMQSAAMLFAWLVARNTAGRPDRARTVLRGVAISAVLAGIYSFVRPPGTLGDTAHLAVWLAISAFLSMAVSRLETARIGRGLGRVAGVVCLAAVAVIGARTPFWAGPHRLLWRDTLSMAASRPLAGYGPEVFLAEFPHFESKALAQADPDAIYESPRNAFLDVLISQGAIGLLLLIGVCGAGFAAAWKQRSFWLAGALAAGIASLQLTSFNLPAAVLLWSAIAVTTALAEERPEERAEVRPSPVLSAVAPVLVLALLYFALRIAMADHELVVTRRLLEARDLRAATAQYEAYWYWRLPGASADIWYARSWLEQMRGESNPDVRAQALAISAEAAARAAENAEEPFLAFYNHAQVSELQERREDARRSLRLAIRAHPNWYLPHWMLAQELRLDGHVDDAQKEAGVAAELAPSRHLR